MNRNQPSPFDEYYQRHELSSEAEERIRSSAHEAVLHWRFRRMSVVAPVLLVVLLLALRPSSEQAKQPVVTVEATNATVLALKPHDATCLHCVRADKIVQHIEQENTRSFTLDFSHPAGRKQAEATLKDHRLDHLIAPPLTHTIAVIANNEVQLLITSDRNEEELIQAIDDALSLYEQK